MSYFITLEGLDFSGKSSSLKAIADELPKNTVLTREPGGTPLAEEIRNILTEKSRSLTGLEKLDLFTKSRVDHIEKIIEPALKNNQLVVSDRYVGSTYAYQVAGDNLPFETVDKKVKELYKRHPLAKPDLTIYFKVSPDVRKQRMNLRSQDDLDKYDEDFYKRVEQAYLDGIKASSKNIAFINADKSHDDVAHQLLNIIKTLPNTQEA